MQSAHTHTQRQSDPQLIWRHLSRRERVAVAGELANLFYFSMGVPCVQKHRKASPGVLSPITRTHKHTRTCVKKLQLCGLSTQPYAFASTWHAHISYARVFSGTVTQKTPASQARASQARASQPAGVLAGWCAVGRLLSPGPSDRQTGGSRGWGAVGTVRAGIGNGWISSQ